MRSGNSPVDVVEVIAQNAVEVRLQPIPSIRRRSPIGVEVLCVTVSTRFRAADGCARILCVHLDAEA